MIILIIPTIFYGIYPNGIINMIWQTTRMMYIFACGAPFL
jgi:hypothetical protein